MIAGYLGGTMSALRSAGGFVALLVTAVLLGSPAPALAAQTWMGGPGCGGKTEWRQHPDVFPYFCDGAAEIEGAHWSNWGGSTATAHATMNEADLRHGASVGAAPRIYSAVTITATHLKRCAGRRTYTSIRIHFNKPPKGPSTLNYTQLLLHCKALPVGGGGSGVSGVTQFTAKVPGGYMRCGITDARNAPRPYSPTPYGWLACVSEKFGRRPEAGIEKQTGAAVGPSGQVQTCPPPSGLCTSVAVGYKGNSLAKTYPTGSHLTIDSYACRVLATSVECAAPNHNGFVIFVDRVKVKR